MPRVIFTPNLQRHIACPAASVEGQTVREALDCVFSGNPGARGYILDDQQALRKHVVIFVDGNMIQDRVRLSDRVEPGAEIYVMQALSGG